MALVHDWLNGMRGGEKVLEHVCELLPDADVYTLLYEPGKVSRTIRRMNVIESRWADRLPALRRHYRKALPMMPRAVGEFPTADYDLVVATSHCVAKGAPPPRRGTMMAYVFTPMRYVWDHFEDYLSGKAIQDTALKLFRGRLQRWDAATAQSIDAIAADSAHIARKIERFWDRRASVIYPSVDLEFFVPSEDPPGDYFLVVSALVPYKHVERAVEAARLADVKLVVVGDGPEREALQASAHEGVDFRGWVPQEDLRDAYQHCRALLYPGVEDYGIAALEAQACGRPVLALRAGGVTETVVEDKTGRFFEGEDAESLAELLTGFQEEDYSQSEARMHACKFSPANFRHELAQWILQEAQLRC
ncbi:glycosyltransferase [bacterium]|nr:glycosyltransferase [bacterium]